MLYISIKFHENILNGFQLTEQTRIYHYRISKENNSKTVRTRVTVLVFYTSSDDALYFIKFMKISNGFQVTFFNLKLTTALLESAEGRE